MDDSLVPFNCHPPAVEMLMDALEAAKENPEAYKNAILITAPEGTTNWSWRMAGDPTYVEAIGLLTVATNNIHTMFADIDDDD